MTTLQWAQTIQAVVTAAGIIVGGIWAYFRFFKGKVFAARVALTVDVRPTMVAGSPCLDTTVTLHNIGASRIKMIEAGTLLTFRLWEPPTTPGQVAWGKPRPADLFVGELWVEAGESITNGTLLLVPEDQQGQAVRVDAWVGVRRSLARRAHAHSTSIAVLPPRRRRCGLTERNRTWLGSRMTPG